MKKFLIFLLKIVVAIPYIFFISVVLTSVPQNFLLLSGVIGLTNFSFIDPAFEIFANIIGIFLPWSIGALIWHLIFRKFINTISILGWYLIIFPLVFSVAIIEQYRFIGFIGSLSLIPIGIIIVVWRSKKRAKNRLSILDQRSKTLGGNEISQNELPRLDTNSNINPSDNLSLNNPQFTDDPKENIHPNEPILNKD